MELNLGGRWSVDFERGPDWVFARLHHPTEIADTESADSASLLGESAAGESASSKDNLATALFDALDRQFIYRLVLEMEEVETLGSAMIGDLVRLQTRLREHGGLLRISGLSDDDCATLQKCRVADLLPHFDCRNDALMSPRCGRKTSPDVQTEK